MTGQDEIRHAFMVQNICHDLAGAPFMGLPKVTAKGPLELVDCTVTSLACAVGRVIL